MLIIIYIYIFYLKCEYQIKINNTNKKNVNNYFF